LSARALRSKQVRALAKGGGSLAGASLIGGASADAGSADAAGEEALLDDPVVARQAMLNAGKAHHAARVSGADAESDAAAAGSGSQADLAGLQRVAALHSGGGGGKGAAAAGGGRGNALGGGAGDGGDIDADAGEQYSAVLDAQAAVDKGLMRRGAGAQAKRL